MVLVMESDGSLTPSRSQSSFARNYNDGIGQGSASDGIAIFGEVEDEQEGVQVAPVQRHGTGGDDQGPAEEDGPLCAGPHRRQKVEDDVRA